MSTFPDLPDDYPHTADIEWGAANGIWAGHDDGTFRPHDPITRGQMASVIRRAVRLTNPELADDTPPPPPPPPVDTTPPVITLVGDAVITQTEGTSWTDPGVTVTDETDPDVEVTVDGTVDTNTPGTYTITYTGEDDAGNTASVVRTVIVVASEPPPPSSFDAVLKPGDNYQSIINAAGPAASIGLADGTYAGFSVTVLTDQTFAVVPGAQPVLDGGNTKGQAFMGLAVQGVTIDGTAAASGKIEIRNYLTSAGPNPYFGVLCSYNTGDWYNAPLWGPNGWHVKGVWIHDCDYGPTLCDDGAILEDFLIEDCGTIGFKMSYGTGQTVRNGEVANCGHNNIWGSWGHEGGGSKNWSTRNLLLQNVKSHGHLGPGLWNDHDNQNSVVDGCEVWDCTASGIFHEISGPVEIKNCHVHDQLGTPTSGIWSRVGAIHIVNSQGTVHDCIIEDCPNGVVFLDQVRDQWTNTTAGTVSDTVLDNAGQSGSGRDHTTGGPKYGTLDTVEWDHSTIELLGDSSIVD